MTRELSVPLAGDTRRVYSTPQAHRPRRARFSIDPCPASPALANLSGDKRPVNFSAFFMWHLLLLFGAISHAIIVIESAEDNARRASTTAHFQRLF